MSHLSTALHRYAAYVGEGSLHGNSLNITTTPFLGTKEESLQHFYARISSESKIVQNEIRHTLSLVSKPGSPYDCKKMYIS